MLPSAQARIDFWHIFCVKMAFVAYLHRARSAIQVITRRQLFQGLGAATAGGVGFGGYALAEPFGTDGHHLSALAAALAAGPVRQARRHRRPARLQAVDGCRAHRRHRRPCQRAAPDCVLLLGDYVAGDKIARYSEPRRPQGLGGRAGRAEGAARRPRRARQSRLVGGRGRAAAPLRADQGRPGPAERRHHPAREYQPCGSSRTAAPSGSPASAISGPSGPRKLDRALPPTTASTISPARWRR